MAQLETNTSVESLGYKQELKRSLTFVDLRDGVYGADRPFWHLRVCSARVKRDGRLSILNRNGGDDFHCPELS
ncbi:hypothetical protein ABEO49_06150 [Geobacillus stearothermophilus]